MSNPVIQVPRAPNEVLQIHDLVFEDEFLDDSNEEDFFDMF